MALLMSRGNPTSAKFRQKTFHIFRRLSMHYVISCWYSLFTWQIKHIYTGWITTVWVKSEGILDISPNRRLVLHSGFINQGWKRIVNSRWNVNRETITVHKSLISFAATVYLFIAFTEVEFNI